MRKLLTTLFFFTLFVCNAQELTSEQVDSKTYNSFTNKDFNSTIQLGNQAIKQGIDYYFFALSHRSFLF